MKAKIAAALDGIPANEASFARVIREMPNIIRRSNRATAFLAKDATPEEIRLASLIRSTAFRYRWAKDDKSGVEDGYSEEEEEEEEPVGIALPTPEHGFIDPRITEAVSEVERLDDENAEQNHTFDEMEIDGTPRLLEQSDQQVSSDE